MNELLNTLSGDAVLLALILLLPGLLALRIRDAITETKTREFKESLLCGAMYVVVVYGILVALSFAKRLGLTPMPIGKGIVFNPWTVLAVFLIACLIGLVAGIVDEKRLIQKAAIRIGLSSKGWRNSWVDAFRDSKRCWACVYLKDGTRIQGWSLYQSASSELPTVFLARGDREYGGEPVYLWPPNVEKPIPIEGPGILITPAAEISLVAFLDGLSPQKNQTTRQREDPPRQGTGA
jgi:hypothetical protein